MREIIQNGRRLALLAAACFLMLVGTFEFVEQDRSLNAQTVYTIQQPTIAATSTGSVPGFTCNWAISAVCRVLVNATVQVTPAFTNPVDGGRYVLQLVQQSGGLAVPLPANVVANGSTTQAVATALASQVQSITMDYVASPLSTAEPLYNATK